MKRGFLLLVLCLSAVYMQAQSEFNLIMNKEGKIIVLPKRSMYEFRIPEFKYRSYTPASTQSIDMKLREFIPSTPLKVDERPMDMQVSSAAYQPFFNVFTPMLRRVSPMALDFNETSIVPLNDNFSFVTNGRQYTWPGGGGLTTISPSILWESGNWSIQGGAFAGTFYTPFNPSPQLSGGVNLVTTYQPAEWLRLKAWGQYAAYGNESNNPHMLMNPFYNHTSVGGAAEFMFNENVGVGVGVNYEYNPIRRRMDPQYLIYPVINTKGVKIGIW